MSAFDLAFLAVIWGTHISSHQEVNAVNPFYEALNSSTLELDVWHLRKIRLANRNNEELDCERPSNNMYICEEPPNVVPAYERNTCNYRSMIYQEQVYRWVAGRGCLVFTPGFLFTAGYNNMNLNARCLYGDLFAPCLEIAKDDGTCGCYPFDPGLEEVVLAIQEALLPSVHGRWERCFYAAADCCSHHMMSESNITEEEHCEATFDGWTCWHETNAGTTATEVCSEFAYSNVGPSCHHFSAKECFHNGTWDLNTDYSTCSITPRLLRRYRFHIVMLAFSIASCLPAVFIFFFYKRLRISRVALHRNLLIAIILRNVLVIISRSEIYIDEITTAGDTVLSTHGIACRVLSVAERIASNAVFVCMLVEGIYLHRLIVAVFRKKMNIKWLYIIGAVIAIVPVIVWAAVMGVYNDHSCWVIYTMDNIQWILDGPRIAILLVNTILFADILRVLLTKIRNSENANQLSTAKTTLFLMPIFGTQFLLTAFRPNTTNCAGEQAYYYVAYTFEGLQGFIVAMLYCYVNKEVRTLVKMTYRKTEHAFVSRVRRESNYPRTSTNPHSDRRFTYSTAAPSQIDEEPKDNYSVQAPKLHVAEIISIQPSERLADILDPVYETIENGFVNEGYDHLERSSNDNNYGLNSKRYSKDEEHDHYYGFTNVSSVSIDCRDWIECSTPSNGSINDQDRKLSINSKLKESGEKENSLPDAVENVDSDINELNSKEDSGNDDTINSIDDNSFYEMTTSDYEDCENMLHEIMQYIKSSESSVNINPDDLSPNRKEEDKIVFVDN